MRNIIRTRIDYINGQQKEIHEAFMEKYGYIPDASEAVITLDSSGETFSVSIKGEGS